MENEDTKITNCGRERSQASEQQPQQYSSDLDRHGQRETADSTNTRDGSGTSSSTKGEHLSSPEISTAAQVSDATKLSKKRVHDAWVLGAGELVRAWRAELGLSMRGLSDALGYSESQVFYWESNREHIALDDLQQLSRMAGKDLEQALRSLQSPQSQDIAIKWKGAIYSIDAFTESTRNPSATVNYSQAQQTFYLKLSPMAKVEFHRRDIITALLEKDEVQAIADLTAVKGTRANIKKADIERMDIKVGDKLNVGILNVRGPQDPPWKQYIQVTPTTTNGETKIQLRDKLGELGLKAKDGNYAKMVIQTNRGERLVTGRIEDGAINLSKNTTPESLPGLGDHEAHPLRVKIDSIVLSPRPVRERIATRAKARDKTTLKLNEGERFTITHENQNYEITTVEREKIGDLELCRYKTSQGEEFLQIPKENKIIPPYETPWYALPPTTTIYLGKKYKHELLEAAIDKAGGKTPLRHELKDRGTQISIKYLNDQLSERMDGIMANKLIPILRYLGRHLEEPNCHITAIGNARAIKNPKLPFNLNTLDGARIIAARFSDGSIHTPKHAGPRFEYTNQDRELRNRIAESLTNVFGKANIVDREYDDGRTSRTRSTTDIIGHTLQRTGAVTGRIITQNPDIPAFIRYGSIDIKREWLRQAFSDEGSPSSRFGITTLSRAKDVTLRLSCDEKSKLDALSEGWEEKTHRIVERKKHVKYCRFKDLPQDIRDALQAECPKLLESEAKILQDNFGIDLIMCPIEIYRREGGYGTTWNLRITSKQSNMVFYNKIGFPQNRKQEALKIALTANDGSEGRRKPTNISSRTSAENVGV